MYPQRIMIVILASASVANRPLKLIFSVNIVERIFFNWVVHKFFLKTYENVIIFS